MSVADDEQRLIDAVWKAAYRTNNGDRTDIGYPRQLIADMRAEGITLTPPPAPEPTYTVRLTHFERETWLHEFIDNDIDPEIISRLESIQPDEVPS